ncbi:hypothetical protein AB0885_33100, partial [Streptomyces sp. NPDC005534]|uniref:hypothetical protein n=1 Tax=Streptomyces sp. NPDC005534 TaxID=3155714 RepID=UPI003451E32A
MTGGTHRVEGASHRYAHRDAVRLTRSAPASGHHHRGRTPGTPPAPRAHLGGRTGSLRVQHQARHVVGGEQEVHAERHGLAVEPDGAA